MNTKRTINPSKRTGRLNRLINRAGLVLIAVGLATGGASLYLVWRHEHGATNPEPLSKVLQNTPSNGDSGPLISGTPVHIAISSVGINLNVIPGYYYPKTQSWTLTPTNAQYGVITAKSNNKAGATFIYGHALMNVFGRLPQVHPGDTAIVTTDNGHTFTYKYQTSSVIPPNNTSLFSYKGKPVLILQTCTGAWYQNRQLFVFNLSKVS